MIAANVERPSGFEAHGGFELLEPPLAYDAFVGLVRELHGAGAWSPKALARFAWRRWCEVSGQEGRIALHAEPLPSEVRRLFDRETLKDAAAFADAAKADRTNRRLVNQRYLRLVRSGVPPKEAALATGWQPLRPQRWDRTPVRALLLHGLSVEEVVRRTGRCKTVVREEKKALGLVGRERRQESRRRLEEAHRGLLAYRAHLRKGLSRAQACEALGIDLKTLKRWQMRRHMARARGDL